MSEAFQAQLPGVLALISEELGYQVAVALASEFGGREIYISKSPSPDSELVKTIGAESAAGLEALLGTGSLLVPKGSFGGEAGRRQAIAQLLDTGHTHDSIARALDVHIRTVERVAAKMRGPVADRRQLGLFGSK